MVRARRLDGGFTAVVFIAFACTLGQVACRPTDSPTDRRTGPRLYTSTDVSLLRRDQIADELELTLVQKLEINEILDEALRQSVLTHASLKGASPAERRAKDDEADEAMAKKVDALLNDKQRMRFRQIRLQAHGSIALTDGKIAAALKLSDEQLNAIRQLHAAWNKAVNEAIDSHGQDVTKALPDMEKATIKFDEKALTVLTPEQQREFEDMQGKKLGWAAVHFSTTGHQ